MLPVEAGIIGVILTLALSRALRRAIRRRKEPRRSIVAAVVTLAVTVGFVSLFMTDYGLARWVYAVGFCGPAVLIWLTFDIAEARKLQPDTSHQKDGRPSTLLVSLLARVVFLIVSGAFLYSMGSRVLGLPGNAPWLVLLGIPVGVVAMWHAARREGLVAGAWQDFFWGGAAGTCAAFVLDAMIEHAAIPFAAGQGVVGGLYLGAGLGLLVAAVGSRRAEHVKAPETS